MLRTIVFKCRPGNRFHFGLYAPDSDTALNDSSSVIHSDTLFAAIVRTYNDMFDDTNEFVSEFEKGAVKISSGFYCFKQDGNWVWFLPKPVSFNLALVDDQKSFKRLSHISIKLWETIRTPEDLTSLTNVVIVQGEYALLKEEISVRSESAWNYIRLNYMNTLPKVHVRKLSREDSLYQLSTVEIADNDEFAEGLEVHYYFLLEENDEFVKKFKERLDTVLEALVDGGIGGERSTLGNLDGIEEVTWPMQHHESEFGCTLSLLSPSKEDYSKMVYYQSMFRGGRRVGNNSGQTVLKSLRMISEGAIVRNGIVGTIQDITPDGFSGVYKRNGVPITMPISNLWIR